MKKINRRITFGLACLFIAMTTGAAEPEKALPIPALNHAVVCPPFKGPAAIAEPYHTALTDLLRSTDGIEFIGGTHPVPAFTLRINGTVIADENGQFIIRLIVMDAARKEQIASHLALASEDPHVIATWALAIQDDMKRRASKLPFECRINRQRGQESISLDRGLGAGLAPGMVLYVSADEEPLISPVTGEIVGRDSPRAVGRIQIFRVLEDSAYARPVKDDKLPSYDNLYARSF